MSTRYRCAFSKLFSFYLIKKLFVQPIPVSFGGSQNVENMMQLISANFGVAICAHLKSSEETQDKRVKERWFDQENDFSGVTVIEVLHPHTVLHISH